MKAKINVLKLLFFMALLSLLVLTTATSAFAAALTWSAKEPMPVAVSKAVSEVVHCDIDFDGSDSDYIIVLGGTTNGVPSGMTDLEQVYNPLTNTWGMSHSVEYPRMAACSFVLGDCIYTIGGLDSDGNPTDTIIEFNVQTGAQRVMPLHLNYARYRAGCALMTDSGTVVVAGGDGLGVPATTRASVEIFNLGQMEAPGFPTLFPVDPSLARTLPSLAYNPDDGFVYVMGGYNMSNVATSSCFKIDSVGNMLPVNDMLVARAGGRAAAVMPDMHSKIIVAGGVAGGLPPTSFTSTIQEYDIASDSWTILGSMPTPRYAMAGGIAVDSTGEPKGYLIGGELSDGVPTNVNECAAYRPTSDEGYVDFEGTAVSPEVDGVTVEFPSPTSGRLAVFRMDGLPPGVLAPVDATVFPSGILDITTTGDFSSGADVTVAYDPTGLSLEQQEALKLWHYDHSDYSWHDITTGVDTTAHTVTGHTTSFSIFVVGGSSGGGSSTVPTSSEWSLILMGLAGIFVLGLALRRSVA